MILFHNANVCSMLLFNRYEYNPQTDLIGKGGFSRVYKAFDNKFKRQLALKIYKTNEFSERYGPIAEIHRVIELDHPNIARYLDIDEVEKEDSFGQQETIQVCVMELLDGGNLAKYYNNNKDLTLFRKLLVDVLHGLSYLHKNGIIHRDIKPANILIKNTVEGPVAKITDFGISKRSDATSNSSNSALIVSIPYMAPEQLNVKKYGIDQKIHFNIDLWSLGVAVYEIITGELLFKNSDQDSSEQVMTNIISPELPDKIKSLPYPFNQFVSQCVIKDAKYRIQSAEELLWVLQSPATQQDAQIEAEAENSLVNSDYTVLISDDKTKLTTEDDAAETKLFTQPSENIGTTGIDFGETIMLETNNEKVATGRISRTGTQQFSIMPDAISTDNTEDITKFIDLKQGSTQKNPEKISTIHEPGILAPGNPKEDSPGKVSLFNRYDYVPSTDLIGKGGFSRVYKAFDKKLSRWVALKIYKTGDFSDRYSPIAEIKRVINLDHSNICRYLDIEEIEKENPFGEKEKIQVCVMELLDSGNFAEFYYKSDRNPDVLKKLLHDVLNGIAYLHKNGIIHRDIKPANILIKKTIEGPVAKITDFGISKLSDSVNNNSSSALIVSIPYMAPEQLNPRKYGIKEKISYNLDLWSFGVTVYEVMTGEVLFKNSEQDSSEQIMANIMAPELPLKINEIPQPFRDIISSCIVKNATERAQKAEELLVLLNSTVNEAPHRASVLHDDPPLQKSPSSKSKSSSLIIAEPIATTARKIETPVTASPGAVEEKKDQWKKFTVVESTHELEKKARKQIGYLKISIAIAALIFIAILLFYLFSAGSK